MGVVLEAFDEDRGQLVALKMLSNNVHGAALYRLKNEFRGLADVAHPNLVRLHELFTDESPIFFSMARVEGVRFVEYVRSKPHSELRSAFAQLVAGVSAIHGAHKLHRDLKPSNVLVSAKGIVTILDFGLVQPSTAVDKSADLAAAGTPAYMAPEQLAGNAEQASDWYAVGTMLYEALTGRLPFSGGAVDVLAAKHSGRSPCPVHEVAPDAPADLAELAMALLSHEPSVRPSGAEIAARIGLEGPQVRVSHPTALFVGRHSELDAMRAAFQAVRNGTPSTVYVSALSGMGKTALVERFLEDVRDEAVVLSGRCYERESVPFKALDSIVDALTRHIRASDPVEAAKLTPRDAGELCRLFPVLARVPSFAEVPTRTGHPQDIRRRGFSALREVLTRMSDRRPVVVAIDDLQWGDLDSGAMLVNLIAPPDPPRVLFVGAYRADEVDRSELLRLLRDRAEKASGNAVRTLDLGPLEADAARELATTLVGAEARAAKIADESGGSPFFIAELARAQTGDARVFESLSEAVCARARDLPKAARDLLDVVALAGGPIERVVALEAAGQTAATDDAIPILRAASMIRSSATRGLESLETYHDRIREAIVASLPLDRAASLHATIADSLEAIYSPPAHRLAFHHRAAGRDEKALDYTLKAASLAFDTLAFDRAAELYRSALELVPSSADADVTRSEIRGRLGDSIAGLGRTREATDTYLAAASAAPGVQASELKRRAAFIQIHSGELHNGMKIARDLFREVGVWVPRSERVLRVMAACMLLYLIVRQPKFRPAEPPPPESLLARRLDALLLGVAMNAADPLMGAFLGLRALFIAMRAGDTLRYGMGLFVAAGVLAVLRPEHPKVNEWADTVQRELEASGAHYAVPLRWAVLGTAAGNRGQWRECRRAYDEAISGFVRVGKLPPREAATVVARELQARVFRTWPLFQLGDIRALREESLAVVTRGAGGARIYAAAVGWTTVAHWLASDEPDTAQPHLDESWAHSEATNDRAVKLLFFIGRALTDIYRGEGLKAHRELEAQWPDVRAWAHLVWPQVRVEFLFWRACAALAAAQVTSGEERRAAIGLARRLSRDLSKMRQCGCDARSAILSAAVHHLDGDTQRAERLLEDGAESFERAEMPLFAAAARRNLARLRHDEAMLDSANAVFRDATVVRPDRFAAMLSPGFGIEDRPSNG